MVNINQDKEINLDEGDLLLINIERKLNPISIKVYAGEAEELSHMEMVAQTINLLNGHEVNNEAVSCGEIESHVLKRVIFSVNKLFWYTLDCKIPLNTS